MPTIRHTPPLNTPLMLSFKGFVEPGFGYYNGQVYWFRRDDHTWTIVEHILLRGWVTIPCADPVVAVRRHRAEQSVPAQNRRELALRSRKRVLFTGSYPALLLDLVTDAAPMSKTALLSAAAAIASGVAPRDPVFVPHVIKARVKATKAYDKMIAAGTLVVAAVRPFHISLGH